MPTLQTRLMNAVPRLVLGTPLHPLMSTRYLILDFPGRTTGRRYTTPVAYIGDAGRLLISTDSPWRRNVADPTPVSVRLRGRTQDGIAQQVADPGAAAVALRRLCGLPGYARAAGLPRVGGSVPGNAIREAVERRRAVIAIDLVAG